MPKFPKWLFTGGSRTREPVCHRGPDEQGQAVCRRQAWAPSTIPECKPVCCTGSQQRLVEGILPQHSRCLPGGAVAGASVTTVANTGAGAGQSCSDPSGLPIRCTACCSDQLSCVPEIGFTEGGKGRRFSYGDYLAVCVLFLLNFLL